MLKLQENTGTNAHTWKLTHAHAQTHTHKHRHAYAYTHLQVHMCTHTHILHINAHKHIHTLKCLHTYTYTYKHTCANIFFYLDLYHGSTSTTIGLSAYIYPCIYTSMPVCLFIYLFIYLLISLYLSPHVCLSLPTYASIYLWTRTNLHARMHTQISVIPQAYAGIITCNVRIRPAFPSPPPPRARRLPRGSLARPSRAQPEERLMRWLDVRLISGGEMNGKTR